MTFGFTNEIEITERLMPAFFIGFAVKLAFADVISTIPAYANAAFLPESVWAIIFLSVGTLMLWATFSRRTKFRRAMLFISASLWITWAGFIIFAHTSGFGEIIWSLIGIQCFWTYHRVRHAPVI